MDPFKVNNTNNFGTTPFQSTKFGTTSTGVKFSNDNNAVIYTRDTGQNVFPNYNKYGLQHTSNDKTYKLDFTNSNNHVGVELGIEKSFKSDFLVKNSEHSLYGEAKGGCISNNNKDFNYIKASVGMDLYKNKAIQVNSKLTATYVDKNVKFNPDLEMKFDLTKFV